MGKRVDVPMVSLSAIVPDGCKYDQCCTHQTSNHNADDGASRQRGIAAVCYLLAALIIRMRFAIGTGGAGVIAKP